ncbi:MAG: hypothetical protein IV100_05890, partial [Myxococcales bacterium]|nr:hypothetical protein [Myxococcales bacterium]
MKIDPGGPVADRLDPNAWVGRHGDFLFRYAMKRLGDRHVAENVVQETFLAALRARERFAAGASERTWLTGILKHKIIDAHRARLRQPSSADDEDVEALLFDESGRWRADAAKADVELDRQALRGLI